MLRHVISHLHADGGAFQIAQVYALRRSIMGWRRAIRA